MDKNGKQKIRGKKMNIKQRIFLATFGILVFCAFISTASGATIYVPDDYAKIQWTVDNTSAVDKIFDNGIWWIEKNSSEPYFGWMKIYLDGDYKGECSRLDFGHKVEGADSWPQVVAIYASGYIRLKECREPDINFSTSFVLGPEYWEGCNYYHNVSIKEIHINSSKLFEIQIKIKAKLPHFNVTYDIEMLEPNNETMKMHIEQISECTNQLTLNESRLNKHEGFKIVQLSSMYINETHHDSDGVKYIDEEGKLIIKKFEDLKTSQFILDNPKRFGDVLLECTHSDDYSWQGNTPNCIISLDNLSLAKECTPQGWITITSNPNDDNVGLWIHDDKAKLEWNVGDKNSVSYWLVAQDNPKIICVPTDYPTIQEAVDNATAGATIIVRSGTYYENVNVSKQLNLIGEGNPVVDAGGSGSAITLSACEIKFHGFTAANSSYVGIEVLSDNNFIVNNTASNNCYGIYLKYSNNNTITNNNANSNDLDGIYLNHSNNNTITSNNVSSNDLDGISLGSSNNNTITNNNANYSDSGCGIRLSSSSNNTITSNNANSNGFVGFILQYSNNNIITGNNVSNNGEGIWLYDSNNNNTITYNNVNLNRWQGIDFYRSNNNIITSNNITLNRAEGIRIESSDNNTITCNNINSNDDHGIYLYWSDNNTINSNNANSNGDDGIYLKWSDNNIITSNNVSNNDDGISLYGSKNNIMINNNANLSKKRNGIYLRSSHNNTITNNNASNNDRGIDLRYSNSNLIYLNNFIDNSDNVQSSESTNIWNSTEKIAYIYNDSTYTSYLGNYWSDYKDKYPDAEEIDSTGIWNTPYSIDSDKDNYPLIEPFENYFVHHERRGDLNGDRQVTAADAIIALSMAVCGEYDGAADVNRDDCVTSLDALMILQAAAGAISL